MLRLRSSAILLAGALLAGCVGSTAPRVVSVAEVVDHGQPSYRIVTPTATWVYHREGAGFSGLLDPAGNDWLAYRPTGGAAGHYRGIPNAVFRRNQEGNNFFHPGHAGPKGSTTVVVSSSKDRIRLSSQSNDGRWAGEWEIFADRAQFRMTRLPAEDKGYWFLYEGTPGGRFDASDLCLRPNGLVTPLSETWEEDMRAAPWVAFISRSSGHALLLITRDPPASPASYRPMENAMTVFGFGRTHRSLENLLDRPQTFTVALIAETDPKRITERVAQFRR